MKNKVLLICLSLLISLGVSAQKYTIYIDDFNSEIKIPNKVLSTIRNVVLDGIQQTNRVNIIDAVSVYANLNLSPLEDARRFRADYLLRGNIVSREATDDGSSHPRYHSRENSFKEKFKLQLDLIRTSDEYYRYKDLRRNRFVFGQRCKSVCSTGTFTVGYVI